jgi:hypothetical protein
VAAGRPFHAVILSEAKDRVALQRLVPAPEFRCFAALVVRLETALGAATGQPPLVR